MMTIESLREILGDICDGGYSDWTVFFCDDDDDDYSVNSIYVDDDGDVCLESTDMDGDFPDYTAEDILDEIADYDDDTEVYFLEEYWDGSSTAFDIEDNWYIGSNDYGNDVLNIDCSEMDDDNDDDNSDDNGDNEERNYDEDEDISKWDIWPTEEDLRRDIKDWEDTIERKGHL